jgi:hypothetical protein
VTTPTWNTLSIDIRHSLRTAANRLADDVAGIYGRETIERFLYSSYDQLAPNATVTRFVPLFAERFARPRLRALAKVEGLRYDGKPTVLFLCTHNAGHSQMALGFFQVLTANRAVGWSGGSEIRTRDQPVRDCCHGRARHRHLERLPETLDRRNSPRRRRGDQHGLRRCLPHLPQQTLRILGRPG